MGTNAVPEARSPDGQLPADLRLRIISYLTPNEVALAGRLSCKDAAQRFSEPHHRNTQVLLGQPLPGHVVDTAWCLEGAQAAMKQLTFRQKLLVPSTAAASGCEANVEFALQLLQPHVFPELLHTAYYHSHVLKWVGWHQRHDLGSAVVSSGLAHLLPSLAQRCPGLLDPGRTLEAAARHCDLAGLQAAWGAVGQRLLAGLEQPAPNADHAGFGLDYDEWAPIHRADTQWIWRFMMAAAASVPTGDDTLAKMEWILEKSAGSCLTVTYYTVCGTAAASGDLARMAWMRDHGFPWGTADVLQAVMLQADLGFIQQLEQEGGYLPPPADERAWRSEVVVCRAAGLPRDSVAKLHWLAGRGATLGSWEALHAAAACGNLEAVQLLAGQPGLGPAGAEGDEHLPSTILNSAVMSSSVPVATWLRQAGYPWCGGCWKTAFQQGDLPMVRWLLEAGCPRGQLYIESCLDEWPWGTPADSGRLVEAVRLLAAAGWPAGWGGPDSCLGTAVRSQPNRVVVALRELFAAEVPKYARPWAAHSGCEAAVEALVAPDMCKKYRGVAQAEVYTSAAKTGDRGTLECLVRLGVPLGEGMLAAAIRERAPVPALQWLVQQGAPRGGVEEALQGVPPQRREMVGAWLRGLPGPSQEHA